MIIVSQDKTEIINFHNTKALKVEDNNYQIVSNYVLKEISDIVPQRIINTLKSGYEIYASFDNSDKIILGKYKTKERAIEVLQGIEQCQKICDDSYFIVYKMPEN